MTGLLLTILKEVVKSCHPSTILPPYLKKNNLFFSGINGIRLIAAGKAAAAMTAVTVTENLKIQKGLCITKKGHRLPLTHPSITLIEAGHPEPDANSFRAAVAIHELLAAPGPYDGLLVLISGGASSLIADGPPGCTPEEIIQTNRLLVNCGASIREINTVRKHLSRLKGGQLALKAWPVPVISLLLSDVPGDDIQTIGSGLTAPDDSYFTDALAVVGLYGLDKKLPATVLQHLQLGAAGKIPETPDSRHPLFKNVQHHIIGNNRLAVETATALAKTNNLHIVHTRSNWQGDCNTVSKKLAAEMNAYKGPLPACFIYGGETTLAVNGNGKGGRNQHMALRLLQELHHKKNDKFRFAILCAGTDGTDGPTDAAGAIIHSGLTTAPAFNEAELETALQTFDAYPLLEKWNALLKTGPTQTNVMDILIAVMY